MSIILDNELIFSSEKEIKSYLTSCSLDTLCYLNKPFVEHINEVVAESFANTKLDIADIEVKVIFIISTFAKTLLVPKDATALPISLPIDAMQQYWTIALHAYALGKPVSFVRG